MDHWLQELKDFDVQGHVARVLQRRCCSHYCRKAASAAAGLRKNTLQHSRSPCSTARLHTVPKVLTYAHLYTTTLMHHAFLTRTPTQPEQLTVTAAHTAAHGCNNAGWPLEQSTRCCTRGRYTRMEGRGKNRSALHPHGVRARMEKQVPG